MKTITIPRKRGGLQIMLSWQVRRNFRYVKMGWCGKRVRQRKNHILSKRIVQDMTVAWRWFPFIEYFSIKEGAKSHSYFSDDPFPLKCYVEYEFWKYKHDSFDRKEFLKYMSKKFQLSEDEILDGCHSVMLDLEGKAQ